VAVGSSRRFRLPEMTELPTSRHNAEYPQNWRMMFLHACSWMGGAALADRDAEIFEPLGPPPLRHRRLRRQNAGVRLKPAPSIAQRAAGPLPSLPAKKRERRSAGSNPPPLQRQVAKREQKSRNIRQGSASEERHKPVVKKNVHKGEKEQKKGKSPVSVRATPVRRPPVGRLS